jgi:hypothetical protein
MTVERIKEIQQTTAYPDSISVQQALIQVWNECEQPNRIYSDTCSVVTYNEDNERMDIIGQNGNEGLHYVSNEEADEDAILNHIQFQSPHKH